MNSLLILQNEGWESGEIALVGKRVREALSCNDFVVGQTIAVARLGGEKGTALVRVCQQDRLELVLQHREPSLPLRSIDVVVGLSRPQTTKKVIQTAVMSGVRSLHLVRTELGEKSYLDSHILKPQFLQEEVVKALQQTGEGLHPVVTVYRSFWEIDWHKFDSGHIPGSILKLAAIPGEPFAAQLLRDFNTGVTSMVLAVGPEAGWTDRERTRLLERGFIGVGLGPRVVRVELALALLLGQTLHMKFEK